MKYDPNTQRLYFSEYLLSALRYWPYPFKDVTEIVTLSASDPNQYVDEFIILKYNHETYFFLKHVATHGNLIKMILGIFTLDHLIS